jgi:hypothetical protein
LHVLRPKYKWKKFYFLETGVKWPSKRTPFRFCRIAKMKGDKMFRSNWENGERGTPEQWKIKP